MGQYVCSGAMLQCSFGMAPSNFAVVDPMRPKVENKPIGNIMDFVPMTNIPAFGMCQSMANPSVASATSAAMGVLTPVPCMPVITAPWAPGAQVMVCNSPALLNNAKCMCQWGGVISVNYAGNGAMQTTGK